MPVITLETRIKATPEIVFDLSRSIDLHMDSVANTHERAVEGVTSGLIGLGESVTWEATHFFLRQRLASKITQFDYPHSFRDSMVKGAFKGFDHDHVFKSIEGETLMTDVFNFRSPFGILGKLADKLFLENYMRTLLVERNAWIKEVAESGSYSKYLKK